ncbi:hypothetical protein CAPTEDRAFT_216108 [Capitella teleta]|uniref:Uncharacterized protein n=1 Tax=Capitella teleta TaxID=283909 RepID=R7U309_CAPTE|nr:hypothetical protein CAPTEDRAFT_216108 [Capitella teleta]|eukprot:ELT97565.1 hypothetical protein CAPTEDRAFT_216108 [Capitella teleta]
MLGSKLSYGVFLLIAVIAAAEECSRKVSLKGRTNSINMNFQTPSTASFIIHNCTNIKFFAGYSRDVSDKLKFKIISFDNDHIRDVSANNKVLASRRCIDDAYWMVASKSSFNMGRGLKIGTNLLFEMTTDKLIRAVYFQSLGKTQESSFTYNYDCKDLNSLSEFEQTTKMFDDKTPVRWIALPVGACFSLTYMNCYARKLELRILAEDGEVPLYLTISLNYKYAYIQTPKSEQNITLDVDCPSRTLPDGEKWAFWMTQQPLSFGVDPSVGSNPLWSSGEWLGSGTIVNLRVKHYAINAFEFQMRREPCVFYDCENTSLEIRYYFKERNGTI